jgi:hypothetical protein
VRARALAPLALSSLVLLGACRRSPAKGDAPTSASARPAPSAAPVARAAPTKPVRSRACRLEGRTTVTEGRGGITHGLAAGGGTVLVTWGELRKAGSGGGSFPDDAKQRFEMARAFDAKTLAPKGAATSVGQQEAADAFSNGVAPFALQDGTLGTATCAWAAFAGKLACRLAATPGGAPFAGLSKTDDVPGPGPQGDRVAAAGVGDAAVLLLPQCRELRVYSTASKKGTGLLVSGSAEALADCDGKKGVDAPALVAAGPDHAMAVWRRDRAIEGRVLAKDGAPRGAIVTLSLPRMEVGAPAVTWTGKWARVAFAARTGSSPWGLAIAAWAAGPPVWMSTGALATGAAPAMAPALAPTDDDACVLVSWTEGKGSSTRVRAGLACNDALVSGSVLDVSPAGVEAGDSELARSGDATYVAWQELPKGKPAELVLAKLVCE